MGGFSRPHPGKPPRWRLRPSAFTVCPSDRFEIRNRRRSIDSKYALDVRSVSRLKLRTMDQQTKDPDVLNVLVLERVDRTKNMARYYVLSVEPTLFAESSLVRRWGRIGGAGRTRIGLHASPPDAQIALDTWLERKQRRGYQLRA